MCHGDGLVLIVDVGVGRKLGAGAHKALEDHDVRLVLKVAGVEGEGHLDLAVGLLRGEDGLTRDGLVARHQGLAGALGIELAVQGVLLAGDEVLVLHGVDDRGLVIHDHILVAVDTVACGGGDAGDGHDHHLVDVLDVLMGHEHIAVSLKVLEHHELGAVLKVAGVEGEGHVDRAVCGLGGEGGLCGDGLAVHLKGRRYGLAVLLALHLHGTLEGVFLAGDEVVVLDGIHDDRLAVGDHVLVVVDAIQRGGGNLGVLDGDRLTQVLHIRVVGEGIQAVEAGVRLLHQIQKGRSLDVSKRFRLEAEAEEDFAGHELGSVLEGQRVEGEGHIGIAVCGLGREGGVGHHGSAIDHKGFTDDLAILGGLLNEERTDEGVAVAGDEVLVMDGIDHRGGIVGGDEFVAVRAIHCGGADFGDDDRDLLVHVVLVGVLGDEGAARIVQLLVDRDGLTGEFEGVDAVDADDLEAARLLSREGVLHGLAVVQHLTGLGIVQLSHQRVAATGEEVGVSHLVFDIEVITHADVRVTVHRVIGLGGDGGLHVGEGAEVVHLAVAAHDDRCLDELVALVGGAAKLLDEVGVVGQCTLGVIRRGAAEPDACGGIQLGAVDDILCIQRPVVGVGLMGVLVPRGGGGEVAVLIRHDHMALAGGLGGELEGHTREAVLTVIALLGELKVAAHDLILERPVEWVDQSAVLGDAEPVLLAVGEQVALTGLDLLDGVEAEGEPLRVGGRMAVLDGEEGLDDLTLGVGHAAHDNGLVVEALDLELGPVEGRAAERVAGAGLDVVLGYLHTAANDVVLGVEGVHLTVLRDRHSHLVGGVEVIVVGGRLADDVLAVRQAVRRGLRHAVLVSDDGLHRLTGVVALAIDRDCVGVVVDDGEGDAAEISTALRGLSGLGVELLDGHATANHRLRDFRKIEGRDTRKIVVLNLLETHIIV